MDMSFALQALCARYVLENQGRLEKRVYAVPEEIDKRVAQMKLQAMNILIDQLTEEQSEYLSAY
jgi:adenosylhomocysteinase